MSIHEVINGVWVSLIRRGGVGGSGERERTVKGSKQARRGGREGGRATTKNCSRS